MGFLTSIHLIKMVLQRHSEANFNLDSSLHLCLEMCLLVINSNHHRQERMFWLKVLEGLSPPWQGKCGGAHSTDNV